MKKNKMLDDCLVNGKYSIDLLREKSLKNCYEKMLETKCEILKDFSNFEKYKGTGCYDFYDQINDCLKEKRQATLLLEEYKKNKNEIETLKLRLESCNKYTSRIDSFGKKYIEFSEYNRIKGYNETKEYDCDVLEYSFAKIKSQSKFSF